MIRKTLTALSLLAALSAPALAGPKGSFNHDTLFSNDNNHVNVVTAAPQINAVAPGSLNTTVGAISSNGGNKSFGGNGGVSVTAQSLNSQSNVNTQE